MRAGEARRTLALRLFIWSLIVTGYVYQTDVIPSFSSEVQQKLALSEKELRPSIYSFTFAFLTVTKDKQLRYLQIWIKHRPKPCLYCFHYSIYANLYYCIVRAHNELWELSFTLQERMGGVGWVRPFRLFQLLKNLRCLKTKAGVFPSLLLTEPIHLLCAVFQIP